MCEYSHNQSFTLYHFYSSTWRLKGIHRVTTELALTQ